MLYQLTKFQYHTRVYSRNLGQRWILARKDTFYEKRHFFMKKRHQNFYPSPYSIPFLSAFLYNFHKRWQHSIVEHNIGLENALHTFFLSEKIKQNVLLSSYLDN